MDLCSGCELWLVNPAHHSLSKNWIYAENALAAPKYDLFRDHRHLPSSSQSSSLVPSTHPPIHPSTMEPLEWLCVCEVFAFRQVKGFYFDWTDRGNIHPAHKKKKGKAWAPYCHTKSFGGRLFYRQAQTKGVGNLPLHPMLTATRKKRASDKSLAYSQNPTPWILKTDKKSPVFCALDNTKEEGDMKEPRDLWWK